MLNATENSIDSSVQSVSESLKTFVNEVFKLGYEVVNSTSGMVLNLLHVSSSRTTRRRHGTTSRTSGPEFRKVVNHRNHDPESHELRSAGPRAHLFDDLWDSMKVKSETDGGNESDSGDIGIQSDRESEISTVQKVGRSSSNPALLGENPTPSYFSGRNLHRSIRKRRKTKDRLSSPPHVAAETLSFLPQDLLTDNTGIIEDIHIATLLFIEQTSRRIRGWNHGAFTWLRRADSHYIRQSILSLPKALRPRYILMRARAVLYHAAALSARIKSIPQNLKSVLSEAGSFDTRPLREIIEAAGYEYEYYTVTTDDGYILSLERIPCKETKHTVYFQHGIIDTSFCWVANGPNQSLAYRIFDSGYDVWMGTLRGTGARLHTDSCISAAKYWDWNLNHHAFYDVPSFIKKIRQVKADEMNERGEKGDVQLTAVTHSMGGAAMIMHIINERFHDRKHHLDGCVLFSPAGIHEELFNSFRYPSDLSRSLIGKMVEDAKRVPALADLLAFLLSSFMGSRAVHEAGLVTVPSLAYHILAGTSTGVFKSFWINMSRYNGRFLAFDYGSEKNMTEYGTATPFDFLKHYDLIDAHMYFAVGLRDNIIRPRNVFKQFNILSQYRPDTTHLKAFDGGHLDFTMGGEWMDHDRLYDYVSGVLSDMHAKGSEEQGKKSKKHINKAKVEFN